MTRKLPPHTTSGITGASSIHFYWDNWSHQMDSKVLYESNCVPNPLLYLPNQGATWLKVWERDEQAIWNDRASLLNNSIKRARERKWEKQRAWQPHWSWPRSLKVLRNPAPSTHTSPMTDWSETPEAETRQRDELPKKKKSSSHTLQIWSYAFREWCTEVIISLKKTCTWQIAGQTGIDMRVMHAYTFICKT